VSIRALIVDDEPLARERIRTLLEAHGGVDIAGECADGRAAVAAIVETGPDLVFLDIQMPEMDGFEVVDALGDELPAIIFVTAFDEYAIRAFDTEAIDYLLKPVNPERFAKALGRALQAIAQPADGDVAALRERVDRIERGRGPAERFVVRMGSQLSFVRADDVDWVEGASNYVRLHVAGKRHLVRTTMQSMEDRLDPARFVRVHRSAIVNIDRVRSLEPSAHGEYVITMHDGARVSSSRTHSENLRRLLS
jgi:two-component system LytT family response regulator